MRIVQLSVDNPVFVNLIMIVVLIWGFMAYQDMNREAFPEVSREMIRVTTTYTGSSPSEMEQLITIPIENELADVSGVNEIESHSVQGRSVVILRLNTDVENPAEVLFDVQSEIDSMSDLPDQADEPEVSRVKTNIPVITVAVSGSMSESKLYQEVQQLEDRIQTIPGVSEVRMMGRRDRKIWVDVNPLKSHHYEIYLPDVFRAVQSSSINRPGGRIPGPVREVLVRTIAKARTSSDVRNRVARPSDPRPIRIDDLANVYPGFEKWVTRGRINGEPGVSMFLFKTNKGDAIEIVRNLRTIIHDVNKSRDDLHLSTYADISEYIKDRIDTMEFSALLALILVLAALFITLNGRIALMTALGLPVSVFGTFLLMSYFNMTINMISLFGLIIVLGIIVDDAIVITENIYRHMENGLPPKEAAVKGTNQVFYPVLATVTTNVAAFLPLLMIGGLTGKFMSIIPIVLTLTLLASLLEAYVVLPSHMAEFVRVHESNGKDWRERWLKPVRKGTLKLAGFCLRHRYRLLVGILVALPLLIYGASFMDVKFFHMEDIKFFRINVHAPPGSSIDYTTDLVKEIEKEIEGLSESELRAYVSSIGWQQTRMGDIRYGSERAQVTVELTDPSKRNRNGEEIMDEIRNELLPFPEVKYLEFIKQQAGPPTGKPVEIEVSGPTMETLLTLSDKIKAELQQLGEELKKKHHLNSSPLHDIQSDVVQGKSELLVKPIPRKVGQYNLTNERISQLVNLAVDGLEAATYQKQREEIEIMTRMDPEFSSDPEFLRRMRIPLPNGSYVPLGKVAKIQRRNAPGEINRLRRERTVTISASVDKNIITGNRVNQLTEPTIKKILSKYPKYNYELGGEYEEQQQAYADISRAFPIAVLIIYTILAGLFNSFVEPLVIVLTVPFSLIGVALGLLIMGESITFTAVMGTVALAGIVVNDSLILVDFIHNYTSDQDNPYYGILRAIRQRIRPVILTTLTTSAGLIPIAFEIGLSGVESFLAPMAVALMYGLLFSTVITLILVPVIYLLFDELRSKVFSLIY